LKYAFKSQTETLLSSFRNVLHYWNNIDFNFTSRLVWISWFGEEPSALQDCHRSTDFVSV
jgi:hypothetical protein